MSKEQKKGSPIPKLDIYQQVTNQIIEQLEKGTIPWRKPWNTPYNGFAANFVTRKEYRGINWFMLNLLSTYEVPYYLTWSQIQNLGGTVKKGAKAEIIFYFNQYYKNANGNRISEEQMKKAQDANEEIQYISFLKKHHVFNITCTEGIEWKMPLSSNQKNNPIKVCEELIDAMEEVPIIQYGKEFKAYYNSSEDIINMPQLDLFEDSNAFYLVLLHELVHWTGHLHRLCRLGIISNIRYKQFYAEEELVAELGASMLAAIAGINQVRQIENSAAYIKSWLDALKKDKKFIFKIAPKAQAAVDYILDKSVIDYESSFSV